MTELLVGTKKGLFTLQGDDAAFEITARAFAGDPVEFATRDERSGRYLACVTSAFYGPKVFVTDDPNGEWEQATGLELPEDAEKALERLWSIVPGENIMFEPIAPRNEIIMPEAADCAETPLPRKAATACGPCSLRMRSTRPVISSTSCSLEIGTRLPSGSRLRLCNRRRGLWCSCGIARPLGQVKPP